ncbi:MAG: hypothetical protein CM15mP125_4140 [Gammaproteobacteria bacterium]|nr:MAG: hypothetical protein CM15mP125_4140 [Gammaproteobacteria bacterium]
MALEDRTTSARAVRLTQREAINAFLEKHAFKNLTLEIFEAACVGKVWSTIGDPQNLPLRLAYTATNSASAKLE